MYLPISTLSVCKKEASIKSDIDFVKEITITRKAKQCLYRPGQALKVLGG
jgi:hypothetical protein